MLRKKIAIDLGTANTVVWLVGVGIVANEPTVVAISSEDNRVVAVGKEAKKMLGRTPEALIASRPMREGVIADYQVTETMLRYFINEATSFNKEAGINLEYKSQSFLDSPLRKISGSLRSFRVSDKRKSQAFDKKKLSSDVTLKVGLRGRLQLFKPDVMICVPAGCTQVERRAALDATLAAGASHAYLIDEPLAAAIGAGIPVSAPSGHMIVDMGGGAAEAAVISLGGVVVHKSVRVSGNKIDEAIQDYLKRKHNLIIGDQTAEEIKIKIGSAVKLEKDESLDISGRDLVFGLPRTVSLASSEVTEAVKTPLNQIIGAVKAVLEDTPPELAADIIDKGIIMSGGTSLLRNLDKLITEETGVPAHVAEDPLYCVVRGTGLVLENIELWKRSITTKR